MSVRQYSERSSAAWIFMDLLAAIARRGWFGAAPSADDGMSLLYASFHIHPHDAERVNFQLMEAICSYGGETVWILEHSHENRFVIYPSELDVKTKELGSFDRAVEAIRKETPVLERRSARDLIKLCDYLYESYAGRNGSSSGS